MWATLCGVVQDINSGCGLHCVVWYRTLTVDVGYTVYDVVHIMKRGCGLHCVVWHTIFRFKIALICHWPLLWVNQVDLSLVVGNQLCCPAVKDLKTYNKHVNTPKMLVALSQSSLLNQTGRANAPTTHTHQTITRAPLQLHTWTSQEFELFHAAVTLNKSQGHSN